MSEAKKTENLWEKKATVKIPFVKGQPEAVNVGVNGRFFLIKKGVEVEVPLPVFEVLQHSENMSMKAFEYEQELTQKAEQLK